MPFNLGITPANIIILLFCINAFDRFSTDLNCRILNFIVSIQAAGAKIIIFSISEFQTINLNEISAFISNHTYKNEKKKKLKKCDEQKRSLKLKMFPQFIIANVLFCIRFVWSFFNNLNLNHSRSSNITKSELRVYWAQLSPYTIHKRFHF